MSDPVISVENLSKRFRIRHQQNGQPYVALRDVLASRLTSPMRWFRQNRQSRTAAIEEFWALKDVSFEIKQGEVVGVIGRNGAGKSTLLKILSRITEPSKGRVTLDGRVASLLEVGTGFHPELTGRENIFLNGAILGMTRAEITRRFAEIVAFAEIGKFLDTPVKRYSSGMYVRLAFAVAAHLEPEILIVDEVLAVGDAEFQKKCLGKIHNVSKGGRTVLFVSHNMSAVQALCSRAIWLEEGVVWHEGSVDQCITKYLSQSINGTGLRSGQATPIGASLELQHFVLSPNPVESGGRVEFSMTFAAKAPTKILHLTLLIYSSQELRVAIIDLRPFGLPAFVPAGDMWTSSGWIKSLPLVEGDYRIGLGISTADFFGNKLALLDLRVAARSTAGGPLPYPPGHRGLVELEFGVNARSTAQTSSSLASQDMASSQPHA